MTEHVEGAARRWPATPPTSKGHGVVARPTALGAGKGFTLPPGPGRSSLRRTVRALLRPTEFFEQCQRRYGDFFTLQTPLERTIVFTSDPEAVREVFRSDPSIYHAGEGNVVLAPLVGSSSVLLLDEASHLRQRRLLLPPFHGERMKSYGTLIEEIAAREIDAWPVGRRFAAQPSMQAITLEVIMRVVLGIDAGPSFEELRLRLRSVLDSLGSRRRLLVLGLTSSSWGAWSPWGRFRAAIRGVDDLIREQVAARRMDPRTSDRGDVLSLLLRARDDDGEALSDNELRDQLMTLLIVGHETTATALAWTLERLIREPTVLERAHSEASRGARTTWRPLRRRRCACAR